MEDTPSSLLPYLLDVVVETFEGEKSEAGLPHGAGKATFKNGNVYEGSWKEGYMHGAGTFVWSDGVQFKGDFVMNEIEGAGTFVWPNGDVYLGDLKKGQRHGKGKMLLKEEGTCYDGEWLEGKKHGYGKLSYDESSYYLGEWEDDLKHGQGIMCYATGNVYKGLWSKGRKRGQGRMDYEDSNSFYSGSWDKDVPHGEGEHVWKGSTANASSSESSAAGGNPYLQTFNRYKGEFKEGLRHGKGTFFYSTGAMYTGDWNKNLKEGEGTFVYEDGTVYKGEFKLDRLPRRQDGGGKPGFSVKVDISDLIGTAKLSGESKTEADLSNSILRFNSELRAIYRKYSQTQLPKSGDTCASSLLSEQIVQMCKDHSVVNVDYQLCHVRDVIGTVCKKLMQSIDTQYYEGSASVLYKDLVEILVRIGFSKYHSIESPAQRFVTLVEKDILPQTGESTCWHYLCSGPAGSDDDAGPSASVSETLSGHKDQLRLLFDRLRSKSSAKYEVVSKDFLKLLKAKDLLAADAEPEPAEANDEKEGKEEVEGKEGDAADGEGNEGGEAEAEAEVEDPPGNAGGDEEKKEEGGEGASDKIPDGEEPQEDEAAADGEESTEQVQAEEAEEEEGEKINLTLKLVLKCIHAANFGSPLTREELLSTSEDIERTYQRSAVTMKFPEFSDTLALCADLGVENVDGFKQKFGLLMDKLIQ